MTARLARLGIAPGEITRILLTHAHPDHLGGVARLRRAGSSAPVAIGVDDLEVGRGSVAPPQPEPITARLLSRVTKPGAWGRTTAIPDATALEDGRHLDIAGGVEVIATPGHTAGHVAFHLPARDVVIGGDVVFNVFRLRPSPAFLCWRTAPNLASVARLAELGAGTLALAHGAPVIGDASGRLAQLIADA